MPKIGRYALGRAEQWRAEGVRTSAGALVWQPLRFFLGRMIIRQGYRDGAPGLVWWWLIATELLLAHFLLLLPEDVARRERQLMRSGRDGVDVESTP